MNAPFAVRAPQFYSPSASDIAYGSYIAYGSGIAYGSSIRLRRVVLLRSDIWTSSKWYLLRKLRWRIEYH